MPTTACGRTTVVVVGGGDILLVWVDLLYNCIRKLLHYIKNSEVTTQKKQHNTAWQKQSTSSNRLVAELGRLLAAKWTLNATP